MKLFNTKTFGGKNITTIAGKTKRLTARKKHNYWRVKHKYYWWEGKNTIVELAIGLTIDRGLLWSAFSDVGNFFMEVVSDSSSRGRRAIWVPPFYNFSPRTPGAGFENTACPQIDAKTCLVPCLPSLDASSNLTEVFSSSLGTASAS